MFHWKQLQKGSKIPTFFIKSKNGKVNSDEKRVIKTMVTKFIGSEQFYHFFGQKLALNIKSNVYLNEASGRAEYVLDIKVIRDSSLSKLSFIYC